MPADELVGFVMLYDHTLAEAPEEPRVLPVAPDDRSPSPGQRLRPSRGRATGRACTHASRCRTAAGVARQGTPSAWPASTSRSVSATPGKRGRRRTGHGAGPALRPLRPDADWIAVGGRPFRGCRTSGVLRGESRVLPDNARACARARRRAARSSTSGRRPTCHTRALPSVADPRARLAPRGRRGLGGHRPVWRRVSRTSGSSWLTTARQGTGFAAEVYACYEAWAIEQGARWLRLGVVEGTSTRASFLAAHRATSRCVDAATTCWAT